ncbi:MAG TPA: hypothetical protein DCS87_03675 [Rheinheimera sp.]|nr:hypothetical protein [Rheinheimera sp.]
MTASEPFSEELHCYGGGSNKVLGLYQYVEDQKRERFKQFGVADWCLRADSPSHGGRYIRIDGFKNHLGRLITKVSFLPDDPNSALFHGQEMALVDYFVHVGVAEELRVVKDLDVKGPIGQRLALGYKVGTFRLFAGLHITDLGPVMILVDDENGRGYYPISEQQIAAYQRDGLLPSPLPTLEYTWQDYFFGYLGWPILLFIVVFRTLDRRSQLRQKLDKQAAEAELLASIEQEKQRQKNHDRRKRREAGQASAKKRWFKRS